MPKIHLRDTRLLVNAGMSFPKCYAKARLLDCDKSRLPTSSDPREVTCRHCVAFVIRELDPKGIWGGERLYWNNQTGYGDRKGASTFSGAEQASGKFLTVNGEWVQIR